MKMPPTVANKQSELLNTDENLQVFKLLGHRCETMATTVIQLFLTEPPCHSDWKFQKTGVLCFVKDNNQKSYFFRLYCLRTNQLVWQHEMYNNMDYQELMPYLHSFEGDQCIIGFHFANNNEAYQFYQVVKTKIDMRKRREERKSRALSQSSYKTTPTVNNNNNNLAPQKMPGFQIDSAMFKKTPNVESRVTKRRRHLTKAEIGLPMDFQHVSHVGWNADTGFDVSTEDENLKHFFKKAGVSQHELEDPELKELIYGFVEKNKESILNQPPNGVSRGGSNNSLAPPPAVPPRGPQNHHKTVSRVAPPPPPAAGPRLERTPSRPHQEAPRKPRPPSPPKSGPPGSGAVVPSSGGGAPAPPPPPPPPPIDFCPPPPPTMGGSGGLPSVPGLGVMDPSSLRPTPPSNHAPVDNPRSNLLQEIQKGMCLKPVDQRQLKPPSSPSPGKETSNNSNDLADVLRDRLKDFLEKRSQAMNLSDTSDTDSNDEEWD